jgi:hypothetical protein
MSKQHSHHQSLQNIITAAEGDTDSCIPLLNDLLSTQEGRDGVNKLDEVGR